jgi:hypothetical protein
MPLSAQNLVGRSSSGLIGAKVGLIGRMNLSSEPALQSTIGSSAQVFAYFPFGSRFYFTSAFDFYYIQIVNSNQVMIEPGIGLRCRFPLPRAKMALIPGASVGFAFLADMGSIPASQFLTYKLSVEVHGTINVKRAWIGELALFHAPVGSSRGHQLSFGPGLLLRLGLAFR